MQQLRSVDVLFCYVLLQAIALYGGIARGDEEKPRIDPGALALRLRTDICAANDSQFEEFYRGIMDMENKDIRYPSASGDIVKYSPTINWFSGHVGTPLLGLLRSYYGQRLENISADVITWCIYPYTPNIDIYGCINSTHRWGTPEFEALGILENFQLSPNSNRGHRRGDLIIENPPSLSYFSVLKGAMATCDVKVPTNITIGGYFALDLTWDSGSSDVIIDFPSQSEAFLIEGQPKNFTCSSYGDLYVGEHWYRRNENGQFIVIPRTFNNFSDSVSSLPYFEYRIIEDYLTDCAKYSFERHHRNRNILTFTSPTINDTRVFLCGTQNFSTVARSLHIAIVYTRLPPEKIVLSKGEATLVCEMKAPVNSTVYWMWTQGNQDECLIPGSLNASDSNLALCNSSAVTSTTEWVLNEEYSMYLSELQIPDVAFEHHGRYSCAVEYTLGHQSEPFLIQQHSIVFVNVTEQEDHLERKEGWSHVQTAWTLVGLLLLCVLVGAVVIASLVLWVRHLKHLKKTKRTKRTIRFSKGHLSIKNELYNEVSLLSPGVVKPHPYEFPRTNLEFQEILGEGRFGKVFKGKANGIVPDSPNLNAVAIKTTASDQLHLSTQQLLSELEIMTKIEPHENICNLLASCTSPDGPLYIIMEYACHGNLKHYLLQCRETLLQRNVPIRISSVEERLRLQQLLTDCDGDEDSALSSPTSDGGDRLHFSVPSPASLDPESKFCYDHLEPGDPLCFIEEGGENTAVVWSTGYDKLAPANKEHFDGSTPDPVHDAEYNAMLTHAKVCDFAYQISSGLQHLEKMNVVHCDLAARNILLSEGFLLKIGDYGMARYVSNEARYQRLQAPDESIVAVRWAAPEVLENDTFSFKSDVWSYAVVLWEIATYGSKPFADFATSLSLDPFIQHLKEGNRLSQPEGLSDSLYEKLCSCWSVDPSIRPSAEELTDYFQLLLQQDVVVSTVMDS